MTQNKKTNKQQKKNNNKSDSLSITKTEINDSSKNSNDIIQYKNHQKIETILIPEKAIIIQEGRNTVISSRIQILATVISAIGIIVVFLMTKDQNKISNDALRFQIISDSINRINESIKTSKQDKKDSITIAIAESSSAINRRSMISAERSAKIQTSPYINLSLNISEQMLPDMDFAFELIVNNTGLTPAYNFSIGTFWAIGTKQALILEDKKPMEADKKNTLFQPSSSLTIPVRIDKSHFPENIIDAIKNNNLNLKIWICFEYDTKWGDHEKFVIPQTYIINRNQFMTIYDK